MRAVRLGQLLHHRRNVRWSAHRLATPTVVQFAGALVAAIMTAPWRSALALSVAVGAMGMAGLVYGALVFVRTLRQTTYEPVWEDWLWYPALPAVSYAALTVTALLGTSGRFRYS